MHILGVTHLGTCWSPFATLFNSVLNHNKLLRKIPGPQTIKLSAIFTSLLLVWVCVSSRMFWAFLFDRLFHCCFYCSQYWSLSHTGLEIAVGNPLSTSRFKGKMCITGCLQVASCDTGQKRGCYIKVFIVIALFVKDFHSWQLFAWQKLTCLQTLTNYSLSKSEMKGKPETEKIRFQSKRCALPLKQHILQGTTITVKLNHLPTSWGTYISSPWVSESYWQASSPASLEL